MDRKIVYIHTSFVEMAQQTEEHQGFSLPTCKFSTQRLKFIIDQLQCYQI